MNLVELKRYSPRDAIPAYPHLEELESQSIYVLREAFATLENPALLWSVGKDSSVLLWLARKAFLGRVPMPCVHVDTGFKIPQMIEFRDRLAERWNLELVVGENDTQLASKMTFPDGELTRVECCSLLKRDRLQGMIAENGFDAVILGIRRDEEGTRAKERYFSPRTRDFEWRVEEQPPEIWGQYSTSVEAGAHLRVHPLLDWSEKNIWEYIDQEQIPVVELYFATDQKRYRSLGCAPCTSPVTSSATSVPEIVDELERTRVAERSTRAQDQESEDAFERLRKSGYM